LALAVGVLMHRHGVSRQQAWARLQSLSLNSGRTATEQADRLLDALEELALSGPTQP
jgi:response regulator NasT